jgi:5-methylcytosine-specific restriction endonuclease McrA
MTDLSELQARAERLQRESEAEFSLSVVEIAQELQRISPSQRRPWLADVIAEIYEEQDGLCALCQEPLTATMDVDHKIPFCYGGGNERANIQLAHPSCNRQKRNAVAPGDLLRYLEDRWMNR